MIRAAARFGAIFTACVVMFSVIEALPASPTPNSEPGSFKACRILDGEINVVLMPSEKDAVGVIEVKARSARRTTIVEELFPVQTSGGSTYVLSADPIDERRWDGISSLLCDFDIEDHSSSDCGESARYWSTVVDNGPRIVLNSIERDKTELDLNVSVAWAALGSASIKRLNGTTLALMDGSKTISTRALNGFAPQSFTVRVPTNLRARRLSFGFYDGGSFDSQAIACIPAFE